MRRFTKVGGLLCVGMLGIGCSQMTIEVEEPVPRLFRVLGEEVAKDADVLLGQESPALYYDPVYMSGVIAAFAPYVSVRISDGWEFDPEAETALLFLGRGDTGAHGAARRLLDVRLVAGGTAVEVWYCDHHVPPDVLRPHDFSDSAYAYAIEGAGLVLGQVHQEPDCFGD